VTLFISENKKAFFRSMWIYAGATVFTAIFGIVYEHFSLGVYSLSMQLAWLYPLLLGTGICAIFAFVPIKYLPGFLPFYIYNFGVAIWTLRSVFIGVIEIYGTTNDLMVIIYTVLGILATVSSLCLYGYGLYIKSKGNLPSK
jgi:hypothetical protein